MSEVKLPILCYHKVGPAAEEGRRLNIEPGRLESHVRFFIRRGFSVVLPEPGLFSVRRGVCFTFDDAYTSALTRAVPIFERYGVRCTFFAVTSLVGRASSWDGEFARPLADWPLLEDAAKRGFMIGNHTATHPRLSELVPNAQIREVEQARDALATHDLNGAAFCYPYGALNDSSKAAVAHHYAIGLALGKRPATRADDPLALPRIVVAYSDALPKLLYKIHLRPLLP